MVHIYAYGGHLHDKQTGEQVMLKGAFSSVIVDDDSCLPVYVTDDVSYKATDDFLAAKALIMALAKVYQSDSYQGKSFVFYVNDSSDIRALLENTWNASSGCMGGQAKRIYSMYKSYVMDGDGKPKFNYELKFMSDEDIQSDPKATQYFQSLARLNDCRILACSESETFMLFKNEDIDLDLLIAAKAKGGHRKRISKILGLPSDDTTDDAAKKEETKEAPPVSLKSLPLVNGRLPSYGQMKHVRIYLCAAMRRGVPGYGVGGFCSIIFLPGQPKLRQFWLSSEGEIYSDDEAYMRGLLSSLNMAINSIAKNTIISLFVANDNLIQVVREGRWELDPDLYKYKESFDALLNVLRDKSHCSLEIVSYDYNYKAEPFTEEAKRGLKQMLEKSMRK